MSITRSTSVMRMALCVLLTGLAGTISLSAQEAFSARDRVWKGGDSKMSNANSWERGEGIPRYATIKELKFGPSSTYQVNNDVGDLRIMSLIFNEGAESYTLSGNPFSISIDTITGVFNHSNVTQKVENQLLIYPKQTTLYAQRAPLLLTGGIRYMDEELTLVKTGASRVEIGGAQKGGIFHLNEGELRFLGQGLSFQYPPVIVMQGGTLYVQGGAGKSRTPQRVNLGTLKELSSGHGHRIIVDSGGGPGTELHFDSWSLGHSLSPGVVYRYAREVSLNINLASPKSSFSVGEYPENIMRDGIIPFVTVTDAEKTGFATIGSNGKVVRSTKITKLGFGRAEEVHFYVDGDHNLYNVTEGRRIHTLTIQGGGTMLGPRLSFQSLLMEEGVGDYTIATDYMLAGSSAPSKIHQYSTQGKLIIKSTLGGDHGNYANSELSKTGPGTVILESETSTMAAGLNVQEGRLEIRGNLLQVTYDVLVYGGTFGGYGQIGGGIRYEWDDGSQERGTLYSVLRIYNGATLDVSGLEGKRLSLHGRLFMEENASLLVSLGQSEVTGIAVTKDPVSTEPAVVLAGDLRVELTTPPVPLAKTLLVGSKDGVTGKFSTINGEPFSGDDGTWFTVDHNGRKYTFRVIYNKNSVEIQAGR